MSVRLQSRNSFPPILILLGFDTRFSANHRSRVARLIPTSFATSCVEKTFPLEISLGLSRVWTLIFNIMLSLLEAAVKHHLHVATKFDSVSCSVFTRVLSPISMSPNCCQLLVPLQRSAGTLLRRISSFAFLNLYARTWAQSGRKFGLSV